MKSRFQKLALATAVATGLAGACIPAQAYVTASAGEALLVPLVVWDDPGEGGFDVNTIIEILVPASIGTEAVANGYTAIHSTPTPGIVGPYAGGDVDEDLEDGNAIHWYFFDKQSVHRLNRSVPVTADDVVQINWRAASGNALEGVPGYIVVGTETARSGAAAPFSMFGQAWLVSDQLNGWATEIPVLPMNDGADAAFPSAPTSANNVLYTGGIPYAVSPLVSGMRTNYADGLPGDISVFDLALSDRYAPTIHVLWLDKNLDDISSSDFVYPTSSGYRNSLVVVNADVFDVDENYCSWSFYVKYELTPIWIAPVPGDDSIVVSPPSWTEESGESEAGDTVCLPSDPENPNALFNPNAYYGSGFVQYYLHEYTDLGTNAAEASGVAFAIKYDAVPVGRPNNEGFDPRNLVGVTVLGFDRGTYK